MRSGTALALALLACTPAADTEVEATPSRYAGDWAGTVSGYADLREDWQTAPYCEGALSGAVLDDGSVVGSGDCAILWGPSLGDPFEVVVGGAVDDTTGALSLTTTFTDVEGGDTFADATLTGAAEEARLRARGASTYTAEGGAPVDAEVQVDLTR